MAPDVVNGVFKAPLDRVSAALQQSPRREGTVIQRFGNRGFRVSQMAYRAP